MKRLEIGDECYVRVPDEGIYHTIVVDVFGRNTIVQLVNWPARYINIRFFNLVYPFPCVKELAI